MSLFDQLYNFARWLTESRDEAEDLSERIKRLGTSDFTIS
jgi:DNA-directed RNA polymerase specialized sigma24 family protein